MSKYVKIPPNHLRPSELLPGQTALFFTSNNLNELLKRAQKNYDCHCLSWFMTFPQLSYHFTNADPHSKIVSSLGRSKRSKRGKHKLHKVLILNSILDSKQVMHANAMLSPRHQYWSFRCSIHFALRKLFRTAKICKIKTTLPNCCIGGIHVLPHLRESPEVWAVSSA